MNCVVILCSCGLMSMQFQNKRSKQNNCRSVFSLPVVSKAECSVCRVLPAGYTELLVSCGTTPCLVSIDLREYSAFLFRSSHSGRYTDDLMRRLEHVKPSVMQTLSFSVRSVRFLALTCSSQFPQDHYCICP